MSNVTVEDDIEAAAETQRSGSAVSQVAILCWNSPAESDRRAEKIAAFLGAEVQFVSVTAAVLQSTDSLCTALSQCSCVIASAETLANASTALPVAGIAAVLQAAEHVFVHGFQPTERHNTILQALTSGGLRATEAIRDSNCELRVSPDHREWCFQFSGLNVGQADPAREHVFASDTAHGAVNALIRIGEQPFFVRLKNRKTQLFLVAGGELADLDQTVPRDAKPLQWFTGLVPLMMFLRGVLRDALWHNDQPRACFIIDDPLLKSRHGFLRYDRLLESLRPQKFACSIAFIPWNYKRSSWRVINLFAANPDMLSLCVHGCDHTAREFEESDGQALRGRATLALDRMQVHQQRTGVAFDQVMVFPQGLFSAEAIEALRDSGYLAAINTELAPSTMPESLALRDLLSPAMTRFGNFPVFGRRYPQNVADFAFDLFLGKPLFVVEHHGYFCGDHEALETFVAGLNRLDMRLAWSHPREICSRAHLRRTTREGTSQLRFYTNRFQLKNGSDQSQNYELLYPAVVDLPWSLTVDGRACGYDIDCSMLKIRLSLDPGQTAQIRVLPDLSTEKASAKRGSFVDRIKIGTRRHLCEFRDNYIDTNPVLRRIRSIGQ